MNQFKLWVQSVLGSDYSFQIGQWVESDANAPTLQCVIQATPGRAPDVEDRRPAYKVTLLGARGAREEAGRLLLDANALVEASMRGEVPCGAANVRATSEVAGPGFTTENRAWVQANFEVLK